MSWQRGDSEVMCGVLMVLTATAILHKAAGLFSSLQRVVILIASNCSSSFFLQWCCLTLKKMKKKEKKG